MASRSARIRVSRGGTTARVRIDRDSAIEVRLTPDQLRVRYVVMRKTWWELWLARATMPAKKPERDYLWRMREWAMAQLLRLTIDYEQFPNHPPPDIEWYVQAMHWRDALVTAIDALESAETLPPAKRRPEAPVSACRGAGAPRHDETTPDAGHA